MVVIIFLVVLYFLYRHFSSREMICRNCGFRGFIHKKTKGSLLIEIILWCCFIIPGLIYSIWRTTDKVYQCPECSGNNIIPVNSPVGQEIITSKIQTNNPELENRFRSTDANFSKKFVIALVIVLFFVIALNNSSKKSPENNEPKKEKGMIHYNESIKKDKKIIKNEKWDGTYSIEICANPEECRDRANQSHAMKKINEEIQFRAVGCERGDANACFLMILNTWGLGNKKVTDKNRDEALAARYWMEKACLLNHDDQKDNNCHELIQIDLQTGNFEGAIKTFQLACPNQDIWCDVILESNENGKMVISRLARKLLDMSCKQGHEYSCQLYKKQGKH